VRKRRERRIAESQAAASAGAIGWRIDWRPEACATEELRPAACAGDAGEAERQPAAELPSAAQPDAGLNHGAHTATATESPATARHAAVWSGAWSETAGKPGSSSIDAGRRARTAAASEPGSPAGDAGIRAAARSEP